MWVIGLLVALAVLCWPGGGQRRLDSLLRPPEDSSAAADDVGTARVRDRGVLLDLLGVALSSGQPPVRALGVVSSVTGHGGLASLGRRLELDADAGIVGRRGRGRTRQSTDSLEQEIAGLLRFSHATGAPIAALLHDRARDLRSRARRRAQAQAAALSVKLVVPLGLCVLPAFFLLGVVPVVISLLGDALAMF